MASENFIKHIFSLFLSFPYFRQHFVILQNLKQEGNKTENSFFIFSKFYKKGRGIEHDFYI